jgi:hypothetical protein
MMELFKALQIAPIDDPLTARIINSTANLADKAQYSSKGALMNWAVIPELFTQFSGFYSNFPRIQGWLDTLLSAARLTRVHSRHDLASAQAVCSKSTEANDVGWIYMALENFPGLAEDNESNREDHDDWDSKTTVVVDSLLQVLACSGSSASTGRPPLKSFRIILRALSASGDISFAAFLVIRWAHSWFMDPVLHPIMEEFSLWPRMGRIAVKYPDLASEHYIRMGDMLSDTPEWKPFMYKDLTSWITVFFRHNYKLKQHEDSSAMFNSVMRRVWTHDRVQQHTFINDTEESWALALTALSKVWEHSNVPSFREVTRLARCTVETSLRVYYFFWDPNYGRVERKFSYVCRALFSPPLGRILVRAAARLRIRELENEPLLSGDEGHIFEGVAEVLEALGRKLRTEFEPRRGKVQLRGTTKRYQNWSELEKHFLSELEALEACSQALENV